ncbi:MAG: ATP-binding protein [Actinobacteria bacterium]|nr:ATP-binding protein [Actinomycetota bacterium]
MRAPISFAYRNLVFGEGPGDAWAVFRLPMQSYAGLSRSGKRELLAAVASMAFGLEADFTLLRVSRPWTVEDYERGVRSLVDRRHALREELDDYLATQRVLLGERGARVPEVYVSVRLPGEDLDPLRGLPLVGGLRRAFGLDDARAISKRRLAMLLDEEEKLLRRLLDVVDADRASAQELQWLIRRGFSRGVGDPLLDGRFEPQALVVEASEADGGARFEPLEADILRLFEEPINITARGLRIESEHGDSHQAFLCLGALPDEVTFPGRQAELLFAPLEELPFPVDAALAARFVPNRDAVRMVRRRIIDADHIYAEESDGEHGPSASALDRPALARQLEEYLTGGDRPPLLKSTISLAVGAPTPELVEERVEQLRREFGAVRLHRPLGEQLELFVTHLPGQRDRVRGYADYLTVEQVGAMVPIATHAVGSEHGPYIGHTLAGAAQPVLFDSGEASRASRSPATLLVGKLGSGKTLAMELIMYQALLAGSTVCDIDPKGDHALDRLPGVAERMEVVELSAEERYRGLLDPLRIGPRDTCEDRAVNFLLGILPEPVAPEWQTEVRGAVRTVVARGGTSCDDALVELEGGNPEARLAARALRVHAESGLARLGFARPGTPLPEPARRPLTSLRIRNLALPLPGTPRSELQHEERIARAVLHLLAMYALQLTSSDRRRHSVLGFDEAWVLLSDAAGRALIDRISRLGRAQNATPLLATQVLEDADSLDGLIGPMFCFGVEGEREARGALRLLGMDEDDADLRQTLMSFRRGRCMMRDLDGRVAPVQIDLLDRRLLEALDTTPVVEQPPEESAVATGVVDD